MIRGTNAQFKFKIPYPKDELVWATIKFWQPNNPNSLLPITRRLSDCSQTDNPNELCVSLIAEETARFSDKYKARVQIRAQHIKSGTVFGSRPELFTVYPMQDYILDDDATMPSINDDGWVILNGNEVANDDSDNLHVGDGHTIIP